VLSVAWVRFLVSIRLMAHVEVILCLQFAP
jgi:hypothetical protein